jgi:DNA-binding XRE family transcriptional regulator
MGIMPQNNIANVKTSQTARTTITPNNVKEFRDNLMMSKAELARKAGISVQTLNRIERGEPCRVDTQRKILEALNLKVEDKDKVFASASKA